MRRAGWKVWIAYDLPGSYEEMPPNLLDELKRDRRWCQGNLINFRLFLWAGPAPGASRGVHDGRDGLPVGAAVVPLPGAVDAPSSCVHDRDRPAVLRRSRASSSRSGPHGTSSAALTVRSRPAVVLFLPKILGGILVHRARRRSIRRRGRRSRSAC